MKDFVVVSFPVQTPSLGKILLHKLQNQNALTFSQKLTLINREIIKPDCIFKPDCRSAVCFHTFVISDFVHVTLVVKLQNQNFVTNFAVLRMKIYIFLFFCMALTPSTSTSCKYQLY